MIIRLYQDGDAEKICNLFTRCSPYLRDTAFWVWINRMLSSQRSIVSVAVVDDLIVGHYAIIPKIVKVGERTFPCGFGIHAVIDPDFRDKVAIYEVSNLAYKAAKEQGLVFLYGFPNVNYRQIQLKLERWKEVQVFNAYELNVSLFKSTNNESMCVDIINSFDYSTIFALNELLEKRKKQDVEIVKSLTYYLNRYINHPQKPYKTIAISDLEKKICGYIFCKEYIKNGLTYFHIIDYVWHDCEDYTEMISSVFNYFKSHCDIFSVWKGDRDFEKTILSLGFQANGFDTFLGVKLLNKCVLTEQELEILFNFDKWALVMGDSDAF